MYKVNKRAPKIYERVKVLIIEDNDDTANTEGDILGRLGFEVARIADGDKAIKELKILKPDIVILDLELPGKTGDVILEEILKDPDLKGIPVIPCSVHLAESSDPENLGNKFTSVFYKYTGAAPEAGVSKSSNSSTSIKDLVVEVTVACGEVFGAIPRRLQEYWQKSSPYKMPPYGILEEDF